MEEKWDAASDLKISFPPISFVANPETGDVKTDLYAARIVDADSATTIWMIDAITAMREARRPLDRMRHLAACERVAERMAAFFREAVELKRRGSTEQTPSMIAAMESAMSEVSKIDFGGE